MGLTKNFIPILFFPIIIGAPIQLQDNSPSDFTAKTIPAIIVPVLLTLTIIFFIWFFCTHCKGRRNRHRGSKNASSEETPSLLDQLTAENDKLKGENKNLKTENKNLKTENEKPKTENENLKTENENLKTENKFLKARFYRAEVTLDPLTAHPRLEISTDGKSVQDTGESGMVLESDKRFDSHTFVLAKEGFAEGCHYWEVDVDQKKTWDLGVASEHICRKGTITLSPLSGYWVIGADDEKEYWARTEEWTRLHVPGRLRKIGIFLNMQGGNLVFFDCDSKTELHSFILVNPGKLYPFFSTGSVREKLDIIPLKIPPWNL